MRSRNAKITHPTSAKPVDFPVRLSGRDRVFHLGLEQLLPPMKGPDLMGEVARVDLG